VTAAPVLFWVRRDFRLADNPALAAAVAAGPVVPVFVFDPETEALGAAAKWRLGRAIDGFRERLRAKGSGLVLRRGRAPEALLALARETEAGAVHWSRLYTPEAVRRDDEVRSRLESEGISAESHPGHLLNEPGSVATGAGGPYRVFTPFWNAIGPRGAETPLRAPGRIDPPLRWPESDRLKDWALGAAMNCGAEVVARHVHAGEEAARARLHAFLDGGLARYARERDRPGRGGSSGLSEALTWGEISPRTIWHAVEGAPCADAFLKELGWREFAAHLLWHFPDLGKRNWRRDWDGFPWRGDNADAERWRRGLTGEPMVDAGMREMFVTGRMHNRVRMLAASYLTKHLLTDWRVGLAWFEDCLTDWDPASNALNWQWVAGSGPDAAPYFRVFSPERQADKFDPDGVYRRHWLEGEGAEAFLDAAPRSWSLGAGDYPAEPIVGHGEGRRRALAAYEQFGKG
jgi:deoxyribodipyrimidine photo-lyase